MVMNDDDDDEIMPDEAKKLLEMAERRMKVTGTITGGYDNPCVEINEDVDKKHDSSASLTSWNPSEGNSTRTSDSSILRKARKQK